MHSVVDKLMLNAAIERLIAREDDDCSAMRTVIAYGSKLSRGNHASFEGSLDLKSSGDAVSGHTAEQGNVTIEDKDKEVHKECAFGIRKERIGHFKIWKEREGLIMFHHFWKSDIATQVEKEDMPEVYHLGYDEKTFEPEYFGYEHARTIFLCWFLLWIRFKWFGLKLIYGKEQGISGKIGISLTSKF